MRIENLSDDPLADPGWNSYLELDALIERALALDLDDDPAFFCFCYYGFRLW